MSLFDIKKMPPKRKPQSEEEESSKKSSSRKRARATEDEVEQPKNKKENETPANKKATDYHNMDFTCTKKNALGNTYNYCISNWNVDGLRAWIKKDGLSFINYEKPDILCLQETKCSEAKLPDEIKNLCVYN